MAATSYFNRFTSYSKMVAHAKNLAKQSVLIDHCGLEHIDLTSEFNVQNVKHVYSIEKETRKGISRLSLVEFKSRADAEHVVKRADHNEGFLPIPLKILRYNGRSSQTINQNLPFPVDHVRISTQNELSPDFSSYTELLTNNMMSLVSLKLRFVTLVNFEHVLCSGIFEEYELMPFGSSVINMGCESGDLDLVITRKETIKENANIINRRKFRKESSRLAHIDKSLYSETKDTSGFRGTMRWFDFVLKEYMPLTDGFGVLSLHRAKVPIIKFTSRITNLECDLSFDLGLDHRENEGLSSIHPGIIMTEVLYSLCRNNNLITALIIYLRIFAKLNDITSKMPGIGMTNFQFLSLVIFFLQQITIKSSRNESSSRSINDTKFSILRSKDQQALIPSFRHMLRSEFFEDQCPKIHYDDDELNRLLPDLIEEFFNFYSNFDFTSNSLNLFDSRCDRKLDNSTLYVMNPIEYNRNICHNVNRKGLETLVKQIRSALTSIKKVDGCCPLQLIKIPMNKLQKQSKKGRFLDVEHLDDLGPFTVDSFAQDACR